MSAATEPAKVIRRAPKRISEFDSRSVKIDQKPQIVQPPIHEAMGRETDVIIPETSLKKDDYEKLAFSEEPVKIIIHRSGERFSAKCTDLIAVNGTHAEMLFKNGWVQIGYLPRGQAIVTKRKYVEQLAHAKVNHITTEVEEIRGADPRNLINCVTSAVCTFSVLEDKNPLGVPWLEQLIRQQG